MKQSSRVLPPLLVSVILLLTVVVPANAATFCVTSATALQNALTTAATNAEDDEILIAKGIYVGNFTYSSSEEKALYVLGGYNSICTNALSNPAHTVLDGNQSGRVMQLSGGSNAEFLIYGLTVRNGKISGYSSGGGLYISSCSNCAVTLDNNRFVNNESSQDGGGASIYIVDSVNIINNSFIDNRGWGGGGLSLYESATATITNNVFRGNAASYGGAIKINHTSSLISNNTFTSNVGKYGGGIYIHMYNPISLYNNIFWKNFSSEYKGADLYHSSSKVSIMHNNIDQSVPGGINTLDNIITNENNLNAKDPLFVDATRGDLRLMPGSPMINAGDPDTPDLPETDFGGGPRLIGAAVDIGAYEFNPQDLPRVLRINDLTKAEGNSGNTAFTFTVNLNIKSPSPVQVFLKTTNGTAVAPSDFEAKTLTPITFKPGEMTKTVTVNVKGNTTREENETFYVDLTAPTGASLGKARGQGTILNDDGPILKINHVNKVEGNAGTTLYNFVVSLSPKKIGIVTVLYATADGTAKAGSDYTARTGKLTFTPGQTTKTVTIEVKGDTAVEANETFTVNLSAPMGATLFNAKGVGTITNDDR